MLCTCLDNAQELWQLAQRHGAKAAPRAHSEEFWSVTLDTVFWLTKCTRCAPPDAEALSISARWVFSRMTQLLGEADALEFLSSHAEVSSRFMGALSSQSHGLPATAFQDLISGAASRQLEKVVLQKVVETVDAHLWRLHASKTATTMSAQVRTVGELERTSDSNPAVLRVQNRPRARASNSGAPQLPRFLEDCALSGHWGCRLDLGNQRCPCCRLPLVGAAASVTNVSASGLLVLPCGHVYHGKCLPEGQCVMCLQEALRTTA